jgi:hypothetical protein
MVHTQIKILLKCEQITIKLHIIFNCSHYKLYLQIIT